MSACSTRSTSSPASACTCAPCCRATADGSRATCSRWASRRRCARSSSRRRAEDLTGRGTFVTKTDTPIEFRTAPAATFAAAQGSDEYHGPGTYFVSLDLQTSNPEPLPVEQEVEFDVSVEGTPQAEPTPERTPAPTATATPAAAEERGGGSAVGLVLAAVAGLLVGLALAAWRRLARGRRTA